MVSGIFAATGQTCIAGSRALIHRPIHAEFVERLLALAKTARMGNPLDASTQVGPVTTRPQYEKILDYIRIAKEEGAVCQFHCGQRYNYVLPFDQRIPHEVVIPRREEWPAGSAEHNSISAPPASDKSRQEGKRRSRDRQFGGESDREARGPNSELRSVRDLDGMVVDVELDRLPAPRGAAARPRGGGDSRPPRRFWRRCGNHHSQGPAPSPLLPGRSMFEMEADAAPQFIPEPDREGRRDFRGLPIVTSEADKRKIQKLIEIRSLGGELLVAEGDVTNLDRMREIVSMARTRFGKIDGVFHAAGVLDDGPLMLKTAQGTARVLDPKVRGTLILEQALGDAPLSCFVLFSSISSIFPPAGQVDYAAASAFLDAFALSRKDPVTVVNWGAWSEVGMAVRSASPHPLLDERLLERLERLCMQASSLLTGNGCSPSTGSKRGRRLSRVRATWKWLRPPFRGVRSSARLSSRTYSFWLR